MLSFLFPELKTSSQNGLLLRADGSAPLRSLGYPAPETVLAVPPDCVSPRWISCLGPASIERQVTGMADTAGYRRHPDERTQ